MRKNAILFVSVTIIALSLTPACHTKPKLQRCTLNLNQAPTLRGFRLGMDFSELQQRFPQLDPPNVSTNGFPTQEIGIGKFDDKDKDKTVLKFDSTFEVHNYYNVDKYPDLKDVEKIRISYADNRVVSYKVIYQPSSDAEFADEFFDKTINLMKFTPYEWELTATEDLIKRQLPCDGFTVRIKIDYRFFPVKGNVEGVYTPSIEVEDSAEMKKPEIRRQQEIKKSEEEKKAREEERRREFQP